MAQTKKKKKSASAKAQKSGGRQIAAILLFAGAILLLCLSLFPGEAVWYFLHKSFRGLFGISVFLVPIVMAYVAFLLSMDRASGSVKLKIIEGSLFMVMVSAALQIFFQTVEDYAFFEAVGAAFEEGRDLRGGGAVGAIFGYWPEALFGDTCAKIVILILVFVFFMLVSGTTLIGFFRTVGKPVTKTRDSVKSAISEYGERYREEKEKEPEDLIPVDAIPRTRKRKMSEIDIAMGDEFRTPERDLREANERVDREFAEINGDGGAAVEPARVKKPARKTRKAAAEKAPVDVPAPEKPEEEAPALAETSSYRYPPISLLDEPKAATGGSAAQEMHQNADRLVQTLKEFNVEARISDIVRGPSVTRYELEPNAGVKISKITGLADDIALRLAASGVRIEAPIPNKAAVGIEVPNKTRTGICLRELIDSTEFTTAKSKLTVVLGKDISGKVMVADLATMPHLLIAGTTGSGKSVCTNSMILSVLFRASPEDVRLILIDPKRVEFSAYKDIPHLLVPPVTDPRMAAGALISAVNEMLNRYQLFTQYNVRDIHDYNELAAQDDEMKKLPQILIVIDELADLMMAAAKEVEDAIVRLAQMARAAGMHLVIATQRPSADVLPGLIRSNIPSRLALTVGTAVESRIILDVGGAEKLLGKGDMLFSPVGMNKPMRIQGGFVNSSEIKKVVDFLKQQEMEYDHEFMDDMKRNAEMTGKPAVSAASSGDGEGMDDDGDSDPMLSKAIEVVLEAGEASTSMLQRRLRLGYSRAGRLIDEMEVRGIIGPHEGSKPRQVLITRQQWLEMNMMSEE